MNFNSRPIKYLRILLFPFSILYGLIINIRNVLFDKNLLKSVQFNLPIIAVGNLSAGGTGKSPMVEYLLTLLKNRYKLAVLSRGYGRKTKGYFLANAETTSTETGDEPMQFYQKFPEVEVAVGEERILAVPQILQDRPETEVIILDDALQHRSLKPGLNILLTAGNNLFSRDFFLPAGNLRDQRDSYKRAEIIVVTKCSATMQQKEKDQITQEINPLPHQYVFFTTICYGNPYHIINKTQRNITINDEILLVCGIADPAPLQNFLIQLAKKVIVLSFSDHHIFTIADINEIRQHFKNINNNHKIIITTEKDATRLTGFKKELAQLPLFVLPVQHKFLFNEGTQFDSIINTFIETFLSHKR